ncbi:the Bromodomain of peregrin, partial [Ramicandelaber brevisporus]
MLAPVSTALRSVHDNVTRLDIQDVFAEPVPISVYPDYYETIKKPMDLSTMSSKINNFEYITFDEYLSDINLIISNCHKYNPYTSYYSRYAYRFKHAIQPILDRAKLSI